MDDLLSFLTSSETPFALLFITLFVWYIRGADRREKACNDTLEEIKTTQIVMLALVKTFIETERRPKKNDN